MSKFLEPRTIPHVVTSRAHLFRLPWTRIKMRSLLPLLSPLNATSSNKSKAPILNNNNNNNIKRAQKSAVIFLALFVVILLEFRRGPPLPSQNPLQQQDYSRMYENARNCEFEDLAHSFSNRRRSNHNDDKTEQSCWKIEDEYLEVPTTAILNRNHLRKLGRGGAGAVFRALIQLSNDQVCYVALKTDHCQDHFWSAQKKDSVACVQDGAYLLQGHSSLKGEITGMVMHYSFYRRGLEPPPGLLPSWAVVKAPASNHIRWIWLLLPRWTGYVYPAHDPTIAGIIMPLRKVTDLSNYSNTSSVDVGSPPQLADIARIMLPAAKSLEVLHGLGMVHQDLTLNNVVISEETGKSLLTDMGLVSKLYDCTSEMCDFCTGISIGKQRFGHYLVEGLDRMESETIRFAEQIFEYFFTEHDKSFRNELMSCTEAWQVVQLLERWINEEEQKKHTN